MVAELALHIERRGPGCTDACCQINVIRPGLLGRQTLLVHDPESHELYGRRVAGDRGPLAIVETGRLAIDRASLGASVDGTPLFLGPMEWRLLIYLSDHIGHFRSYVAIVTDVWGADYLHSASRTLLASQLSRLRQKLGPRSAGLIETRLKLGLRLRDWPIGEDAPPVLPGIRGMGSSAGGAT